jgi:hypothetical protein
MTCQNAGSLLKQSFKGLRSQDTLRVLSRDSKLMTRFSTVAQPVTKSSVFRIFIDILFLIHSSLEGCRKRSAKRSELQQMSIRSRNDTTRRWRYFAVPFFHSIPSCVIGLLSSLSKVAYAAAKLPVFFARGLRCTSMLISLGSPQLKSYLRDLSPTSRLDTVLILSRRSGTLQSCRFL